MSPASGIKISPRIFVGGPELDAAHRDRLVELRIDLQLGVPSRAELRFSDVGYALAGEATMQLASLVKITSSTGEPVIEGEITAVSVETSIGVPPLLVVVAHDRAHRLGRGPTVTTYQNQTVRDVVSKIAGNHGLTAKIEAPARPVEYLLQAESDLVLLDALARRSSCDWWVAGRTLHFGPPDTKSAPIVVQPPQLVELSVRATGARPNDVVVDGWDTTTQKPVRGQAKPDNAPKRAQAKSPFVDAALKNGKKLGVAGVRTSVLAAASLAEATALAESVAARSVAAAVTAKGEVVEVLALGLGRPLKAEGVGPLSGTYHLTAVEHVYRPSSGLRSRFVAGDRSPTTLVDLLGGRDATAGPFRHTGMVVGDVTNINDPERRGRVRVRFLGLDGANESGWARMVTQGGGNKRGVVFLPEVGDEVLVGFEDGDVRHPAVIGGLYGNKSVIPGWDVTAGKVLGRHITSRLGHTIELRDGDSPTDQLVRIALQGKLHEFVLAKDRVELTVPAAVPVTVKAGLTKIAIAANGDVSVDAPNITMKALNKISLEATLFEVKARATASVQAQGAVDVKGALVGIQGQGPVIIKGATVAIN
ncbi:VgrG-related protein [soil metagenome]